MLIFIISVAAILGVIWLLVVSVSFRKAVAILVVGTIGVLAVAMYVSTRPPDPAEVERQAAQRRDKEARDTACWDITHELEPPLWWTVTIADPINPQISLQCRVHPSAPESHNIDEPPPITPRYQWERSAQRIFDACLEARNGKRVSVAIVNPDYQEWKVVCNPNGTWLELYDHGKSYKSTYFYNSTNFPWLPKDNDHLSGNSN